MQLGPSSLMRSGTIFRDYFCARLGKIVQATLPRSDRTPLRQRAVISVHTMSSRIALGRRFTTLLALAATSVTSARAQTPIAITGVTVIDGRDSVPRLEPDGGRAGQSHRERGSAARAQVPAGARVIDGRGKFLVPGLLGHARPHRDHRVDAPLLSLYVANGVTGVRDMAGDGTR